MENEKVLFSEFVRKYTKNNKTMIANTGVNTCMMISSEVADIFTEAGEKGLTFGELYSCIEDEASRKLIEDISRKLDSLYMWKHDDRIFLESDHTKISIDLTNKCNLRCRHCCVSANDGQRGRELTTEELMNIVDRIAWFRPNYISVSGGEPLVRSDFRQFTDKLRSFYHGKLVLMTNAVLIDNDEIAQYLTKNYDAFDISLDGYDEETCAAVRGKGVFGKVLNAVKLLQKYDARISLSMVKTKYTEKNVDRFNDLCRELNVIPMVRVLEPLGRASDNYEEFRTEGFEAPSCEMSWEQEKNVFMKKEIYKNAPNIFSCKGADYEFQIDQKGDVYPCPLFMTPEFRLFNILDEEVTKEYIENKGYSASEGYRNFKGYMPYNFGKCSTCEKQLLCFSCAGSVKKCAEYGSVNHICDKYGKYYDLYWENYGTV